MSRHPEQVADPKSTGFVTTTSQFPGVARSRLTVALMLDDETNWTGFATMSGWPTRRNLTVGVSAKFEPEIVRTVEPVLATTEGLTLPTVGPVATVRQPVQVAVPWSVFVRVRLRPPVVAEELTVTSIVNVVASVTTTFETVTPVPDTTTPTPAAKPDPCSVTDCAVAPWPSAFGVAVVASGLAVTVKQPLQVPDPPSGLVTFNVWGPTLAVLPTVIVTFSCVPSTKETLSMLTPVPEMSVMAEPFTKPAPVIATTREPAPWPR
jgi:hypothetical protein